MHAGKNNGNGQNYLAYGAFAQVGYLLIGEDDAKLRIEEFQNEGYKFKLLYTSDQEPVLKQTLQLYQFWKM